MAWLERLLTSSTFCVMVSCRCTVSAACAWHHACHATHVVSVTKHAFGGHDRIS